MASLERPEFNAEIEDQIEAEQPIEPGEVALNPQKYIRQIENPFDTAQRLACRLRFGVRAELAIPRLQLELPDSFEADFFGEVSDVESRKITGSLLQEIRNLGLSQDPQAVETLQTRIIESSLSPQVKEYLLASAEVVRDEAKRHHEIFEQLNIKFDEHGLARGSAVKKLFERVFGEDAKGVEDVLMKQSAVGVTFLVRYSNSKPPMLSLREGYYEKRPTLLEMKISAVEIGDSENFEEVALGKIEPYTKDIINHEEQHAFFDVMAGQEKLPTEDYRSAEWAETHEKRIRNEILAMFVGGQLDIRTSPAILKTDEKYNGLVKLGNYLKRRGESLEFYNKQKEASDRIIESTIKQLTAAYQGRDLAGRQELAAILQTVPMERWGELL